MEGLRRKMKDETELRQYKNAIIARGKNARIAIYKEGDDTLLVQFIKLHPTAEIAKHKAVDHSANKNIATNSLMLTHEGARRLILALTMFLHKESEIESTTLIRTPPKTPPNAET